MSNAGAVVAAMRLRKERQIIAALRERGALSAAKATALDVPRGLGRGALRSLKRHGAVVEVGDGAYYFDEAAYDAMRSKRRYILIGVMLVVLVAAIVAVVVGANS